MGRLIPAGTGMEFYRKVKVANDPTMKDMSAEEMDETQSYIEQMVAAASARPAPEPEPEEDLEELGFDDEGEAEFTDVVEAETESEFELPDEFAFETEEE